VQLWKGWVLGFVSGANVYADNPEIFSRQLDAPAIYAWIDNYCRSNPLESVYAASISLVRELLHRANTEKTSREQ
jgi:hypothetical protein